MQSQYIDKLESEGRSSKEQVQPQGNTVVNGTGSGSKHDLGGYEAQLMLAALRDSGSNVDSSDMDASLTRFLSPVSKPRPPVKKKNLSTADQQSRPRPRPQEAPRRKSQYAFPRTKKLQKQPTYGWNGRRTRGPSVQAQRRLNQAPQNESESDDEVGPPPPEDEDGGHMPPALGSSKEALLKQLEQQALKHESEIRSLKESKNAALEELHNHWKQVSDKRKQAHAQVTRSVLIKYPVIFNICVSSGQYSVTVGSGSRAGAASS